MFGVVHTDNTGTLSTSLIVNADVDPAAGIVYSKLELTGDIVNSDISASAAIDLTKLATLSANFALISNASGYITVSPTTALELSYVSGVTSSIQDQLDAISGSAITALTGDVSATGPGSVTATIQPGVVTGGIGGKIAADTITNYNINPTAAIAYSKLNLSNSIVNADVNTAAAIAYSKLNLSNSIVNADINTAAAIALSKLAALPAHFALISNGAGIIDVSVTTDDELAFLSGASSNIQDQLNAITGSAITNIYGDVVADGPGSVMGTIQLGVVTSSKIAADTILNVNINSAAAIAYSKLNLSNSIVNADINTSAAIARSKLASGSANHVIINDGSGVMSSEAQLSVTRGGTGTGTAFTAGSVIFAGASGVYSQNNAQFFWDNTNIRLSLGATTNFITLSTTALGSEFTSHATTDANTINANLARYSDTAAVGASLVLSRTRNTEASKTIVQSGDQIANILGLGFDGTDYEIAAQIVMEVDGTPGSNDMPGRMLFKVTPDGSATPATALSINNAKRATFFGDIYGNTGLAIYGDSATSSNLTLRATDSAFSDQNTGRIFLKDVTTFDTSWTVTGSAGSLTDFHMLRFTNTITSSLTVTQPGAIVNSQTFSFSAGQILRTYTGILNSPTLNPTTSSTGTADAFIGTLSTPIISPSASITPTINALFGNIGSPRITRASATTITVTNLIANSSWGDPQFGTSHIVNATIDSLFHYQMVAPANSGSTVTNHYGLYIPNLALGTNIYGIYSLLNSATNKWFIYGSGTAASAHNGLFSFSKTTAPAVAVDVNGAIAVNSSGSTTTLTADNQVVTIGNRSYIRLSSDNATATNRTWTPTQGLANGQIVVFEWTHATNRGELIDDGAVSGGGNTRLNGNWTPNSADDTLTLLWNGTDWIELFRSNN